MVLEIPALVEFMPMDVPGAGWKWSGVCIGRDPGDVAAEYDPAFLNLKTYYAGQTWIMDRSLELSGPMQTLEQVSFVACAGLTNTGIAFLPHYPT